MNLLIECFVSFDRLRPIFAEGRDFSQGMHHVIVSIMFIRPQTPFKDVGRSGPDAPATNRLLECDKNISGSAELQATGSSIGKLNTRNILFSLIVTLRTVSAPPGVGS